jgi:hypothetical protein
MESSAVEQRTNMKFCFQLGKTVRETHGMLVKVYGDVAASREAVYRSFERFRGAAESTEEEQRSDGPSTSTTDENVSKINEMIRANRRLTIRNNLTL